MCENNNMKYIDKINANTFIRQNEYGVYICNLCGNVKKQYETISCDGFNLVCKECVKKLSNVLLSETQISQKIMEKGYKIKCRYIAQNGDCSMMYE